MCSDPKELLHHKTVIDNQSLIKNKIKKSNLSCQQSAMIIDYQRRFSLLVCPSNSN